MKNLNLWRKISNITAFACGIGLIIHTFFYGYIKDFAMTILPFEIIILGAFLLAELMKYLIKKKLVK